MVSKIYTFQNCGSAVEELHNPEGELDGRAFIIIDNDTGDVYRYPMPLEVAGTQGKALMGLDSSIEVANGSKAAAVVRNINQRPKR